MNRSYKVDIFVETGFNAVDIPCSPQLLYDEFGIYKTYTNCRLVQDEWEAMIRLDDLTPEEARKIDYVIITDEEDDSKLTCYTVKNYQFRADDTVNLYLLLDPYNTMGGFIKGSDNNIVISGSANRLTVPLHHKDGVYERSEDNDFFVLDEPFSPAQKLVMHYGNFNWQTIVPQQFITGGIGLVHFNIMFTRGYLNDQKVSYLDLNSFKSPVEDEEADNLFGVVPFKASTVNTGAVTEQQFYEQMNNQAYYKLDSMYHITGKYYLTFNRRGFGYYDYPVGNIPNYDGETYNSKRYGWMLFFSKDNSGDDSQGEVRKLVSKMQEVCVILAGQLLAVVGNTTRWTLKALNSDMITKWLMIYAQAIDLYQNAIYEGDGLTDSIVRVGVSYNGAELIADVNNIDLTKVVFLVKKGATYTEVPFSV